MPLSLFNRKKAGTGKAPPAASEVPQVINSELQDTQITTSEPKSGVDAVDEKADSDVVTRKESSSSIDKVQDADEDGRVYPKGLKLIGIVFGLCCSIFLVALDQTIIATAIPSITNQFHRVDDIGWYGSAYFLTSCSLQPTWGKIYQNFSIKWFFILAVFLFELGSLICGVAPSSTVLIIGRAIAGLGVSGIFSGGLTIIAYSVPLVKRPAYMGMIGAMFGIASVAGPLMGGVFTEQLTWRWCFYINLPIGAITIVSVLFLVNIDQKYPDLSIKERVMGIDFIGAFFLLPAVICLLLALQFGGTTYPWNSSRIIGLFVGFAVLAIIFAIVQKWKGDKATMPPRILALRSVWASCIFACFFAGSFFIMAYFIPIYFQSVKGSSAVHSGIQLLPLMIAVVISSIFWGILISKIGYYTPILIGGAMFLAIGAGLITTWKTNSPTGVWFGYMVVMGLGAGGSFQIPLIAVQTVLSLEDIPTGTAIVNFSQSLGGALFIAIAQTFFTNTLTRNLNNKITDYPVEAIISFGATGFRKVVPEALLEPIEASYMAGLTATYRVSLIAGCIAVIFALCVEFKSVKDKKGGPGELAIAA